MGRENEKREGERERERVDICNYQAGWVYIVCGLILYLASDQHI